jgi:hypothetical protein
MIDKIKSLPKGILKTLLGGFKMALSENPIS